LLIWIVWPITLLPAGNRLAAVVWPMTATRLWLATSSAVIPRPAAMCRSVVVM